MQIVIYPTISKIDGHQVHVPVHFHVYNSVELCISRNGTLPYENHASKIHKSKIFAKSIINGLKLFKKQRSKQSNITLEINGYNQVVETNNDRCFSETVILDIEHQTTVIMIKATIGNYSYYGESHIYKDDGYAVISDIDDTMRLADAYDLFQLLSSSLYYNYTAVKGMPELFTSWKAANSCRFYYVSQSPDQLYSEFSNFMQKYQFPFGQYMGRHFRWYYDDSKVFHSDTIMKLFPTEGKVVVNENQQESTLADSKQVLNAKNDASTTIQHILTDNDIELLIYNHKYLSIYKLVSNQPSTKFVLIGDDTAHDPFIFSKIYKHFPSQVRHLFIRHVEKNNHLLNKNDTCTKQVQNLKNAKKALKNTPHVIFTDPTELPNKFD